MPGPSPDNLAALGLWDDGQPESCGPVGPATPDGPAPVEPVEPAAQVDAARATRLRARVPEPLGAALTRVTADLGGRRVVLSLLGGLVLANLLAAGVALSVMPAGSDARTPGAVGGRAGATPSADRAASATATTQEAAPARGTGQAPRQRPATQTRTPADRALVKAVGAPPGDLLGEGWSATPAERGVLGAPFAEGCLRHLPATATPATGWHRTVRGPDGSGTLQGWAHPAGLGAPAVDTLWRALERCDGAASVSLGGSPVAGADGFTATAGPGDQTVTWSVWRRGDVVVSFATATFGVGSGLDPGVARRLDGAVREALDGSCADPGSTADDARRNPYAAGRTFTPYVEQVQVTPPAGPRLPDPRPAPDLPLSLPQPKPFPSLAPPQVPPTSQWIDVDADGAPDVAPPLEQAETGPVPTLVDPDEIAIPPDLVPTEPVEPPRPSTPDVQRIAVPAVDTTGPGCGWSFTGVAAPETREDDVRVAAERAIRQGLVDLTAAQAQYQLAQLAWVDAYREWSRAKASHTAYLTLVAAQEDARAALSAAQEAHREAVAAYQAAQAPPTPDPTDPPPTPTATTPEPTTTTDPTPSPTPTPTPTGGGG